MCTISLSVLKLTTGQEYLLGNDLLPTIFYSWGRISFYIGAVYIQRAFFQLALGSAMAKNKHVFVKAERIAWMKVVSDVITSLVPLIACFIDEGNANETMYMMNGVLGAVGISGTVYAAVVCRKSVKTAFKGSSDARLARLEEVLNETVKSAIVAAGINVPLFLLWGLVKSFYGFWTYLLPAQYGLIMVASVKLIKSLNSKGNKKGRRVSAGGDSGASSSGGSFTSTAMTSETSMPVDSVA